MPMHGTHMCHERLPGPDDSGHVTFGDGNRRSNTPERLVSDSSRNDIERSIFTPNTKSTVAARLAVHGHLLRLDAELLVPRLDRVGALRQPLDLEAAVIVADREERVWQDAPIAEHPPVHLALERHHDLGLVERPHVLLPLDHLREVELGVRLRDGMHVVHGRIAVDDLDRLPDLHAEHVRRVPAPDLIEHHRRLWRLERPIAETVFHVHEDVLQLVVRDQPRSLRISARRLRSCTTDPMQTVRMTRAAGAVPLSVIRPLTVLSPGSGGGGSAGACPRRPPAGALSSGCPEPHAAITTASAHSAAPAWIRNDINLSLSSTYVRSSLRIPIHRAATRRGISQHATATQPLQPSNSGCFDRLAVRPERNRHPIRIGRNGLQVGEHRLELASSAVARSSSTASAEGFAGACPCACPVSARSRTSSSVQRPMPVFSSGREVGGERHPPAAAPCGQIIVRVRGPRTARLRLERRRDLGLYCGWPDSSGVIVGLGASGSELLGRVAVVASAANNQHLAMLDLGQRRRCRGRGRFSGRRRVARRDRRRKRDTAGHHGDTRPQKPHESDLLIGTKDPPYRAQGIYTIPSGPPLRQQVTRGDPPPGDTIWRFPVQGNAHHTAIDADGVCLPWQWNLV